MNFSFNTFLVSTSGLPSVFEKTRSLISKRKLSSCTGGCKKAAKKNIRVLWNEN